MGNDMNDDKLYSSPKLGFTSHTFNDIFPKSELVAKDPVSSLNVTRRLWKVDCNL